MFFTYFRSWLGLSFDSILHFAKLQDASKGCCPSNVIMGRRSAHFATAATGNKLRSLVFEFDLATTETRYWYILVLECLLVLALECLLRIAGRESTYIHVLASRTLARVDCWQMIHSFQNSVLPNEGDESICAKENNSVERMSYSFLEFVRLCSHFQCSRPSLSRAARRCYHGSLQQGQFCVLTVR